MKTKEVLMAINGKKLPIALIVTILGGGVGYGQLKGDVKHNAEQVEKLDKVPEQIASIETDIENIKENFIDFRTEQRSFNSKVDTKLDKVLEALIP